MEKEAKINALFWMLPVGVGFVATLILPFVPVYGAEVGYCKKNFGSMAQTSFEPKESNRGGVNDNFVTRISTPIKIKGVKKPTGFVCLVELDESLKGKCPSGLRVDSKRGEFPVCISKVFPLKDLCPVEINEVWPDLTVSVCKPGTKQKVKSKQ